jgi:gamma-glutamyl:cysteine ligase YbdK (ATP-grasp superfamily)
LAACDGTDARPIDPAERCLIPALDMLDSLLADCRPHTYALGCADALHRVKPLVTANGAER